MSTRSKSKKKKQLSHNKILDIVRPVQIINLNLCTPPHIHTHTLTFY